MTITPKGRGVGGRNFFQRFFLLQGTPSRSIRMEIGAGAKITPYPAIPFGSNQAGRNWRYFWMKISPKPQHSVKDAWIDQIFLKNIISTNLYNLTIASSLFKWKKVVDIFFIASLFPSWWKKSTLHSLYWKIFG